VDVITYVAKPVYIVCETDDKAVLTDTEWYSY